MTGIDLDRLGLTRIVFVNASKLNNDPTAGLTRGWLGLTRRPG